MRTQPQPPATPPQVVLRKKGFLPLSSRERKESLDFRLFRALKHLFPAVFCWETWHLIPKRAAGGFVTWLS